MITECGLAYLHGKSRRQRAEALIAVAAPGFRDELMAYAVESKTAVANGRDGPSSGLNRSRAVPGVK